MSIKSELCELTGAKVAFCGPICRENGCLLNPDNFPYSTKPTDQEGVDTSSTTNKPKSDSKKQ